MLESLRANPGKASAIASGGLSISVALMLFASKGEVDMIRERQAEVWRELQDIRLILMQRSSFTNSIVTVSTP